MFKKTSQVILTVLLVFGLAYGANAEVKDGNETASKASNMAVVYPLQADVLPQIPPTPESIKDTEAITKWVNAVNAYMDAAQKYIDGATDDLNHIVEQRNMAIENANKVVAEYNAFFEKHQGKK